MKNFKICNILVYLIFFPNFQDIPNKKNLDTLLHQIPHVLLGMPV